MQKRQAAPDIPGGQFAEHVAAVAKHAIPLDGLVNDRYAAILNAVGNARVVMIGEASHGTHEFYHHRAEMTKQLIERHGFNCVAIEADWPDAYRANRYVHKGKTSRDNTPPEALDDFKRFPMWMWRNEVVSPFIQWLRDYNEHHRRRDAPKGQVAFYGMDLYSMYTSMDAVVEYLQKVSPEDAKVVKERYSNFDRFQGEPSSYGFATASRMSRSYENEVLETLCDLRRKGEEYLLGRGGIIDGDELFYAEQNASLVARAEEYYRNMLSGDENTWNIRDSHMADCVKSLLDYHEKKSGRQARVVIWAHSSHLGDARATSRSAHGELNLGQLMRQRYGLSQTFNIALSTYSGSVTAASNWDEPAEYKKVRNGLAKSYEHLFHSVCEQIQSPSWGLVMRSNDASKVKPEPKMIEALKVPRLERYIGVIYRPDTERASHYSATKFAEEFDAVLFFDKSSALVPLDKSQPWKSGYAKLNNSSLTQHPDMDTFPELDSTLSSNELVEWRISAAIALNRIAMDFENSGSSQLLDLAIEKYDKALKYLAVSTSSAEQNRQVAALRNQLLLNRATVRMHQKAYRDVEDVCTRVLSMDPSHSHAQQLLNKAREAKGIRAAGTFSTMLHEATYQAADKNISNSKNESDDILQPRSLEDFMVLSSSSTLSNAASGSKRKDLPIESA